MNQVQEILAEIGTAGKNPDGSFTRECYSAAYFDAVNIVKNQMEQLNMETFQDKAGNIRGVLRGNSPNAKSIIMGSHLDTVPSGGLLDGAYGVAGGLAVIRKLKEEKITLEHTLELYGFNAEESNPIGGTFGSRAVAGLVDPNQPGLKDALALYGRTIEDIMECKRDFSDAKYYLELHIEQGDYLVNNNLDIGVVSGIVGIARYKVTAMGHSNHAGTTMMNNRKDALVAMSKLIVEADKRCREINDTLVLTVGTIQLWPGSENVIPEKVECTFEIRHLEKEKIDTLVEDIKNIAKTITTVDFEITEKIYKGSINCDETLMQIINNTANSLTLKSTVMPSGAGHDANSIAYRLPVGMIFVPSCSGLSHCKEEWTQPSDQINGADVLYNVILSLDK